MTHVRRLTSADVACWLLKTATLPAADRAGWAPGTVLELDRCVRPTYRLSLVRPGQPCLLWLSGRHAPGVQAVGVVTVAPHRGPSGLETVGVRLRRLRQPVARADLVQHPLFRGAEVVRMAAGSNPSYLTRREFSAVQEALEEEAGDEPGLWSG